MSSLHQSFQPTGQPLDTEATFTWLDRMDGNPLIQQVKRQMLDACPVRKGDHILDVGCGLGHEARRLAEGVGPQGRVVGIDANPVMIAEARRRAADLALPLAFEVGDAHHVDFPDNAFDLCRTERVLRYLDRPEAAVGEMERLARPGGAVIAFDFDSDQTVVDAPDRALTRRIADVGGRGGDVLLGGPRIRSRWPQAVATEQAEQPSTEDRDNSEARSGRSRGDLANAGGIHHGGARGYIRRAIEPVLGKVKILQLGADALCTAPKKCSR